MQRAKTRGARLARAVVVLRLAVSLAPAVAATLALALPAPGAGSARAASPTAGSSAGVRLAPPKLVLAPGTGSAAPATAPASIPVPIVPGVDPRLLPSSLPGPAATAPAGPPAPTWKHGTGTPEPKRLAGAGPSTVILPVQTIPLNMNHKFHLNFLACADCHTKAPTSKWATDWLIPGEAQCTDCHDIDRADLTKDATPGAACSFCHRGFDPKSPTVFRVSLPAPHLKFPHEKHIAKGFACERCHVGVKEVGYADRDELPKMALCLECHNGRVAADACSTCHFTEKDGKLKVEWPEGTLTPGDALRGMAHIPGWEFSHDEIASTDAATCMACHREEECAICHDGVARPPTIHVGDYALKHAVDARRADPDCSSCHRLQTFCLTCHTRMGVSLAAAEYTTGAMPGRAGREFHPPGWNAPTAGMAGVHHSTEARKNITSCISCHREKDCTRCHAEIELFCRPGSSDDCAGLLPGPPFGGAGDAGLSVSPHPARFDKVCKRFMKRSVTACLRCHTTAFLETACSD